MHQSDRQPRHWRIGDVTVTKIVDAVDTMDLAEIFDGATAEAIEAIPWLRPHFLTPEGLGLFSYHALVVDTPTLRIIVDTCIGNDKDRGVLANWSNRQASFLRDLEQAGFPRDSFDVVLCTHLHVDHVGWNTMLVDGQWVPTFPKARYIMNAAEFGYWKAVRGAGGSDFDAVQERTFADSVQPVHEAGLIDLVEGAHRLCDEVSLVPTPGHSIGHVSVRISSRGEEAIITGDVTHHPCQLAHPDWGIAADYDGAQAKETRRQLFSDAADRPVLVIGTHWAGATAGAVERSGPAFRLRPA